MAQNDSHADQPKPRKRRRLRRRWIVLIVVASIIVLLVVAAFVTAHFTSRSSFCNSCHEMEPYYSSWQVSSHAATECKDCHIPPGFVAYVQAKFFSLREVWVHIAGDVESPLAVTREIPDSSCLRCHTIPQDLVLGDDVFSHQVHGGPSCIACHVRFVHEDVNPPYYRPPATHWSCFECHDGVTATEQCSDCHTPSHEVFGECNSCHTLYGWTGGTGLRHSFPLTGGHAELECTDCHTIGEGPDFIPGTTLNRPDADCLSCHADEHNGLADCERCHSISGWKPANFTHPRAAHISRGEVRISCSSCHPSGYGSYTCARCHSGGFDDDGGEGDDD